MIRQQSKELAKQRRMIAEYEGGNKFYDSQRLSCSLIITTGNDGHGSDLEDDDNQDVESQDENDMGRGARLGGGFTSAVSV